LDNMTEWYADHMWESFFETKLNARGG